MVSRQQRMKSIHVIQQQEFCGDTNTPLLSLKQYCIRDYFETGITTSTTDCPPTKLETARTRGAA